MFLTPYRSVLRRASRVAAGYRQLGDLDLLPVFALLWLVSAAVVVRNVFRHDVFGPEGTLALVLVVALPWLTARPRGPISALQKR